MKICLGKSYKMRNGQKAGPITTEYPDGEFGQDATIDRFSPFWTPEGKCSFFSKADANDAEAQYDLVAEWGGEE